MMELPKAAVTFAQPILRIVLPVPLCCILYIQVTMALHALCTSAKQESKKVKQILLNNVPVTQPQSSKERLYWTDTAASS